MGRARLALNVDRRVTQRNPIDAQILKHWRIWVWVIDTVRLSLQCKDASTELVGPVSFRFRTLSSLVSGLITYAAVTTTC
jgi:hypothetical protein